MDTISLQQKRFEDVLANGSCVDPVQAWSEYAKWAAKHRPCEHISILARACKELTENPKHHGDVKLLRLWVRFADSQGKVATHTFFGSLEEQGIGTKHALLYEAWAASLEAKRLFTQADAVYEKGIKRSAQPLTRLQKNVSEFRHRMARRKSREVRKRQRASADADKKRQHTGVTKRSAPVLRGVVERNACPLAPIETERQRVISERAIPQKKPEVTYRSNKIASENIPPAENGQQKQDSKYNASRDLIMPGSKRCMRSDLFSLVTQKRRSSLRIPLRRSLSQLTKMQGLQSDKRRRLSALVLSRDDASNAQIGNGSGAVTAAATDIQQPIVQTVVASGDKQESAIDADGVRAIGEQITASDGQFTDGDDNTIVGIKRMEIKEDASWRIPKWLPFRSRGC